MFNTHDIKRNAPQIFGKALRRRGYDWWWHSFTGYDEQTGEQKSFFIEFYLCNPELGTDKPVFGPRTEGLRRRGKRSASGTAASGEQPRPSYLMVKCGCWGRDAAQLHRFYSWKRIEVGSIAPFYISAGDCFLSEDGTHGIVHVTPDEAASRKELMCQSGEMAWSLVMDKQLAFNVGWGASRLMRKLGAFEMFWHAEGMKTAYSGYVIWNGRKYNVRPKDCYGYADKNWGRAFTSPWIWLSSNNLVSTVTGRKLNDSAFDIGGGRPKVWKLTLPGKLLSAIWLEGKGYEFNFSKFWTFCRTKFDCYEGSRMVNWKIEQRTLLYRMVADFRCPKNEMLLINYRDPDGKMLHKRLWNGGTGFGTIELYRGKRLIDKIKARNVGCEYGDYNKQTKQNRNEKNGNDTTGRYPSRGMRRTGQLKPGSNPGQVEHRQGDGTQHRDS